MQAFAENKVVWNGLQTITWENVIGRVEEVIVQQEVNWFLLKV